MSGANGSNLRAVEIHLDQSLVRVFKEVAARKNCTMKFAIEAFLYAAMRQAKFEGEMGRKWKEEHERTPGIVETAERMRAAADEVLRSDEGVSQCDVKDVHEEAKSEGEDSTTSRESGASRADQSTPRSSESESGRESLN